VRRIWERFPNEYWLKLDHEGAYPTEFVRALTEAGYLSALIPEDYGGSPASADKQAGVRHRVCRGEVTSHHQLASRLFRVRLDPAQRAVRPQGSESGRESLSPSVGRVGKPA